MYEITVDDISRLAPVFKPDRHKGDGGTALMLCGSKGYAGAAALAAKSCYRCGAGIVRCVVSEDIYGIVSALVPEAVFSVSDDKLSAFFEASRSATAAAVGCGLGAGEDVKRTVREIISAVSLPLVLDADGLNALSDSIEYIKNHRGECVITPHPGEAARLLGCTVGEIQSDRVGAVKELAKRSGAVALLKGHGTLICDTSGNISVLTLGNAGMAKGGSGDVLTGIITSFLAQGMNAFDAAVLGAAVHSRAGDLAAERFSQTAMLPSDMISLLPEVFGAKG